MMGGVPATMASKINALSSGATPEVVAEQSCRHHAEFSSAEPESCSICLQSLSGEALGVCLGPDGCRKCLHYFHLGCLQRVEGGHCPQCRVRFSKRAFFPNFQDDAASWVTLASLTGKAALTKQEVSAALRATLPFPADAVDAMVDPSGNHWTEAAVCKVLAAAGGAPAYLQKNVTQARIPTPVSSADDDAKHEDGHSRSGVVCRCGQIHVRRGDRVCRGPAKRSNNEEGISPGHLGTIARVEDRHEAVIVKWDRSPLDKAHRYTWPDPDGRILAPAPFGEVAPDVAEVQKHTGLSSAAAEELLRRVGFDVEQALAISDENLQEEQVRKAPLLFHQVRILPDSVLVQQWFDCLRPCGCNGPHCRGGLQWSSRADKHLGREGMVLKIDTDDDTVLVETIGPCQCKIWYPRLAVELVYNPDLVDRPMHKVKTRVECRMEDGWLAGIINDVLWDGANRRGPCPYTVTLDDGRAISVPSIHLIRKPATV